MKKLAILLCALAAMLPNAAFGSPKKLTFSVFEPPQAFGPTKVYPQWIRDVTAASDGTIEIEMLAGGQMGPARDQLKLLENRVFDMALIIPGFTPGRFPGDEIATLPFLWDDPSLAGMAVARLLASGELKYPGIKVVGIDVTGPYQIHSSKKIQSLKDLRGLRLRAPGPASAAILTSLGATPVGIPPPQMVENISRGLLDGTLLNWALVNSIRIIEVAPHHFVYPFGGTIALVAMNNDVWESLPDKAKAAFNKYGPEEFARRWGEVIKQEDKAVLEAAKRDPKQTVVYPDEKDAARMKASLTSVVDGWAKKSEENARLLEAFKRELTAVGSK
jgi:TRAP-type C4-dicarboxylate transport system substrate-binding protein